MNFIKNYIHKDVLIEYAHIYTDEKINSIHLKSAEILYKEELLLDKVGLTHGRMVMVDDYNPDKHTLNIQKFIEMLNTVGFGPDMLFLESEMVYYAEELISMMANRLQKKYKRYVASRGKYPCSLLLTVAHLIKFGYFEVPFKNSSFLPTPIIADKIIVILQEKYRYAEEQGLDILKSASLTEYIGRIKHIYY